jgi:predicted metal-dependent peptidase
MRRVRERLIQSQFRRLPPGSKFLILAQFVRKKVSDVFQELRRSDKRVRHLAVALDTSGLIDGELLSRFTAEISSMCAFNQRNLVLLIGDAAVQQIIEIDWTEVSSELSRIKYTGGGGTDFCPLIKAAAEFEPDALIYLTDLTAKPALNRAFR